MRTAGNYSDFSPVVDHLRLYRAIRFLKKYNLTWAEGTERVFNRIFIEHSQDVNPQRVLNELNKC